MLAHQDDGDPGCESSEHLTLGVDSSPSTSVGEGGLQEKSANVSFLCQCIGGTCAPSDASERRVEGAALEAVQSLEPRSTAIRRLGGETLTLPTDEFGTNLGIWVFGGSCGRERRNERAERLSRDLSALETPVEPCEPV